jgi:hypothetical protein
MCSLGSGTDAGVGSGQRLAIGNGTTLGGPAAGGGVAGGVRQTLLGGRQGSPNSVSTRPPTTNGGRQTRPNQPF